MATHRPLLAITMGDPAGVGPEVVAKALDRPEVWEVCRPLVIGDAQWMEEARRIVGGSRPVRGVHTPTDAGMAGSVDVLDLANVDVSHLSRGQVSPEAGPRRRADPR